MDLTVYKSYDRILDVSVREELISVLNGSSSEPVKLPKIFPNFIRVPGMAMEAVEAMVSRDVFSMF